MGTLAAGGETAFGTSVPEDKWENLASRAASLSGFFAIFCDVSRNMYIF